MTRASAAVLKRISSPLTVTGRATRITDAMAEWTMNV
jgi:hypothetical protein